MYLEICNTHVESCLHDSPNSTCTCLLCGACLLHEHVRAVQDELAGLAEQDGHRGIADQVDSNVLFRQGEEAQVSEQAAQRCWLGVCIPC